MMAQSCIITYFGYGHTESHYGINAAWLNALKGERIEPCGVVWLAPVGREDVQ